MALDSMQEIFDKIEGGKKPFWKVVLDTDVEERQVTAEASFEKMRAAWRAMLESVDTYRSDRRSVSGLVGGDGLTVVETDQKVPADALERLRAVYGVQTVTYYEKED